MLTDLTSLAKVVVCAVSRILSFAENTRRKESLSALLTAHYCLRLVVQTGRELMLLAGTNPRERILSLDQSQRDAYRITCQRHLSLQLSRLHFLRNVIYAEPILDLFDHAVRAELDRVIGNKEEGLYSVGAALQFHFVFGTFPERKDDQQYGREVAFLFSLASLTSLTLGVIERNEINLTLVEQHLSELENSSELLRVAILKLCSPTEALVLVKDAEAQALRIGHQ